MVGANNKNRLSPPLMFAFRGAHEARDAKTKLDLRDEDGERVIAGRRSSVRTAITEPMLRREVARDLEALMNTLAIESAQDPERLDYVPRSIFLFVLPDVTHRSIDEV